jgi:hypothetical protein
MPGIEDIAITVITEDPGTTIVADHAAALDITVEDFMAPAVLEVEAETVLETTILDPLAPAILEILGANAVTTLEVPAANEPEIIEIVSEGPQGAPGLQNVFVGPTPPDNPQDGWVWINTG